MTTLWLPDDHMKIRRYSVAGAGGSAVVKIEIEVSDTSHLGYFLEQS